MRRKLLDPKIWKAMPERYHIGGDVAMERWGTSDIHTALFMRDSAIRKAQNTPLARKLAELYEKLKEIPFPGGIENAYIQRYYPGHWQRSEGASTWSLEAINIALREPGWEDTIGLVHDFYSNYTAKQCVKEPERLIDY